MNSDGFFDLQVNGYIGVDFNGDALNGDDLRRACQRLADDGNGGILATVITERIEVMARRLRRRLANWGITSPVIVIKIARGAPIVWRRRAGLTQPKITEMMATVCIAFSMTRSRAVTIARARRTFRAAR